jgi:hypothetical protein
MVVSANPLSPTFCSSQPDLLALLKIGQAKALCTTSSLCLYFSQLDNFEDLLKYHLLCEACSVILLSNTSCHHPQKSLLDSSYSVVVCFHITLSLSDMLLFISLFRYLSLFHLFIYCLESELWWLK